MNGMRLRGAIALLWTATAVSLIGVLMSGLGAGVRLWLLTALAFLAAPSSFATVPVANWLIGRLDMQNSKAIDLFVSTTIVLFGYVQWFVLPTFFKRAIRHAGSSSVRDPDRSDDEKADRQDSPVGVDASVVVFYGDDTECLSLKMVLEGSGIEASMRNYSMESGGRTDVRVSVRQEDLRRAGPLVEHFQEQLRNSPRH